MRLLSKVQLLSMACHLVWGKRFITGRDICRGEKAECMWTVIVV